MLQFAVRLWHWVKPWIERAEHVHFLATVGELLSKWIYFVVAVPTAAIVGVMAWWSHAPVFQQVLAILFAITLALALVYLTIRIYDLLRKRSHNRDSVERKSITGVHSIALAIGVLIVILVSIFATSSRILDEIAISDDDALPGFSSTAGMKIGVLMTNKPQYLFQFTTPEGAQASLYLSRNNIFVFSIRDIHGDIHNLEIPIGRKGLPLDTFVFVSCEVGVDSNATYMRVLRNGSQIERKDIPFRLDLGSENWPYKATFGADNNGQNNAGYLVSQWSVGHITWGDTKKYEMFESRLCTYFKAVNPNLVTQTPHSSFRRMIDVLTNQPSSACPDR